MFVAVKQQDIVMSQIRHKYAMNVCIALSIDVPAAIKHC